MSDSIHLIMAELESKHFVDDPPSSSSPAPVAVVAVQLLTRFFHTLSLTLLTLLLPLSFLLLSRLTNSPHFLHPPSSSFLSYTSLLLLHLLVPLTCLAALFHAFTGRRLPRPAPTCLAWSFLCIFQLCVGIGIETTITAGVAINAHGGGATSAGLAMWVRRVVFVVGLYETMLFWSHVIVRRVVDDTVYGIQMKEGNGDRVVIGLAFGLLWLWLLREEVELVLVAGGSKKWTPRWSAEMGWCYVAYRVVRDVTVTIGMVRIAKGFLWIASLLLFFYSRDQGDDDEIPLIFSSKASCEDEKV